jgi:6-phosphogluconolactonase
VRVEVLDGPEGLALRGAEVFAEAARAKGREGCFRVVLAGGRTPRRMYELLGEEPFLSGVPWDAVEAYFGDERCVGPDEPGSNYGMARQALLWKVGAREHRIRAERGAREAALEYEGVVRDATEDGARPFDLVLLGMGADGHTASLFPGAGGADAPGDADGRFVREVYVEGLAAWRVTLTYRALACARRVIFMVAGAEKAGAVRTVLASGGGGLPASRVRPVGGDILWLLDRAAAGRL